MKTLLLFLLTFIFFNIVSTNAYVWQKFEKLVDNELIKNTSSIKATTNKIVIIDSLNKRVLISFDNQNWNAIRYNDISEEINKICAITLVENYEYYLVETSDLNYQLIRLLRQENSIGMDSVKYYKKYKYNGDTLNEFNNLVVTQDPDILIAYSDGVGNAHQLHIHRLDYFSDSYLDSIEYDSKVVFMKGKDNLVNKETDRIFCNDFIINDDNLVQLFFTKYRINAIFSKLNSDGQYKKNIDFENNISEYPMFLNIKSPPTYDRNELYLKYYKHFSTGEKYLSYFLAVDSTLNRSQDTTSFDSFICCYNQNLDTSGLGRVDIQYKIPFKGIFSSNFAVSNNQAMILYRNKENNELYTFYTRDLGDSWDLIKTPELDNKSEFRIESFDGKFYIYNENEIYVSDIATEVKQQVENDLNYTIINNIIDINCSSIIESVLIYDINGRLLNSKLINNTQTKIDLTANNNLLIICIKTKNGYKILKINQGEN